MRFSLIGFMLMALAMSAVQGTAEEKGSYLTPLGPGTIGGYVDTTIEWRSPVADGLSVPECKDHRESDSRSEQ